MEAKITMICMDTSRWMRSNRSARFKDQAEAIELYITNMLRSHVKNEVGVFGTSGGYIKNVIRPCRDLQRIMDAIYCVSITGPLTLMEAIKYAHLAYLCRAHMPIRIAAFAGGNLSNDDEVGIQFCGQKIKDNNVALDVVNFGKRTKYKRVCLEMLVDAANNNNGNTRILHVPRGSSVRDALSKFIGESNLAPLGSLSMQEESATLKKKDCGENLDPHKDMSTSVNHKEALRDKIDDEKLMLESLEFLRGENKEKKVESSSTMKAEITMKNKEKKVEFSSTMKAEVTIISMDTSMWMGMDYDMTRSKQSFRLKQQIKVIELYITERLESHLGNLVAVCSASGQRLVRPSRDLEYIMSNIREYCYSGVIVFGTLSLVDMITFARMMMFCVEPVDMRVRIAVFVGGRYQIA